MHDTSSKQLSSTKLWMVLVGVNHYQDGFIPNLKYCANDCKELAEALTIATKQFKEAEIIALHDGGIKPNLEEVLNSIKKFRLAKSEDTILFYFSGHGELDRDNRPVLGVTDTKVIQNEANNTLSFDSATGLRLDRLLEEFRNSSAQSQLIWLDACQAKAEINGEQNNANGQIIAVLNQESQQTRPGKNFFAMLSCDQTERSWEFDELGHGLFTYSLIRGLQGNAANAEGKIGVNSLFNYVKNNIAEYLKLKKHPVTTEAANNSAKGLVIKPTKQVKRFPANVYQNPRKIDSSGEVDLIIGAVAPANSRKALICDRLSSSLTDIEFCRLLQDRGGFTVEHCFLEAKTEKNLAEAIAGYLQDKDNETVLLYLAGEIENSDRAEYSLAVNPKSKVNLNWLGQLIRDSPVKEAIVIVDVIQQQDNYPDIRDILNPDANRSLCIIAASSTKANRKLISQLVEILTVAAEADQQFWAATLITQLQKKADFPQELRLQKAGLYSSSTAINILLPKSRRSNKQTYDLNICPYKSLQAFTQDDAYFFHGREALIAEILEKLATNPFLAVVGASGSGKSSVVRAGVIPQLTAEGLYSPQFDEYLPCKTYVMRPGDNPLTALATALAANDSELAEGFLHIGVNSFISWLQQQPQTISVLIIDQFEELFTTKHKSQSNSFIEFILQAIALSPDCFKVIITLRDDFLKDCLANQKIDPLFRQSHILVRPYLKEDEYRQILKQPAQKVGLTIEDELVNVLLQELQTESLPLLQFALDELWRKRTPGELTLANYQENIGGLGAILGKKAEQTLSGLNKEQQECAQTIFQDLVQLGEGKEDTRRRVSKRKLAKTKHQAVFDSTLKALVDARLLVIGLDNNTLADNAPDAELENQSRDGETTVEIAHEILIRNWDTLRWWLDTNRNQIRLTRELEQRAEEWVNTPKDKKDDFLLSEASLIKYQDLYRDRADELSDEVNQFVGLSIEKCDQLKQEEELRKNKELDTEVNYLIKASEALRLSEQTLDALITALWTGRKIKNSSSSINVQTKIKIIGEIQNIFCGLLESNRIESHKDNVNQAVISSDGEIIATASSDKTAKLWSKQGKLLCTLGGHQNDVKKVAFSLDGKYMATASADNTAKIWANRGTLLCTLEGHISPVNDVLFSPDNQIIITTSWDKTAKFWTKQGKLFYTIRNSSVSDSIVLSPNGQTIAFSGRNPYTSNTVRSNTKRSSTIISDRIVRLWNIRGELVCTLEGHTDFACSVAFSPNGQIVATGSCDNTVKIWNIQGDLLATFEGHSQYVSKVIFSPDGQFVASASQDKTVILWDLQNSIYYTLNHINPVRDIVFDPNSQIIATANDEGTIKLWNIKGQLVYDLKGHTDTVNSVKFSPNGQILASASNDKSVKLWNIYAESIQILRSQSTGLSDMQVSPDGQILISTGFNNTNGKLGWNAEGHGVVEIWDTKGQLLHILNHHTRNVNTIAFSPDGHFFATASSDGIIKLWDIKGNLLHTIKTPTHAIKKILFNPNGKSIYSISSYISAQLYSKKDYDRIKKIYDETGLDENAYKTVKIWDTEGGLLHSLEHQAEITDILFNLDEKILASADTDGIIRLWNQQGELLYALRHSGNVTSLEISPDEKIFASADTDGTVKLWNWQGKLLSTLKDHTDGVNSVIFSPNGQTIASASQDKTIKLWNLQGKLLCTFEGHTKSVEKIVFSPDGKILASAANDWTIKLWSIEGKLIHIFKDITYSLTKRLKFSSDGLTLYVLKNNVQLWSLDLDKVMTRGCDWVRDYLENNPNVREEERKICDRYNSE